MSKEFIKKINTLEFIGLIHSNNLTDDCLQSLDYHEFYSSQHEHNLLNELMADDGFYFNQIFLIDPIFTNKLIDKCIENCNFLHQSYSIYYTDPYLNQNISNYKNYNLNEDNFQDNLNWIVNPLTLYLEVDKQPWMNNKLLIKIIQTYILNETNLYKFFINFYKNYNISVEENEYFFVNFIRLFELLSFEQQVHLFNIFILNNNINFIKSILANNFFLSFAEKLKILKTNNFINQLNNNHTKHNNKI